MFLGASELRGPFGRIASNVAVITTLDGTEPHGSTGTAWAEDPRSPFVVTPLNRTGATHALVLASGRFAASLLAADQAGIAKQFAGRGDRFADIGYTLGPLGLALIDGAVVAVECQVENSFEFGTYDLIVGRVESATHREGAPVLTYCDATFGMHLPAERGDG